MSYCPQCGGAFGAKKMFMGYYYYGENIVYPTHGPSELKDDTIKEMQKIIDGMCPEHEALAKANEALGKINRFRAEYFDEREKVFGRLNRLS